MSYFGPQATGGSSGGGGVGGSSSSGDSGTQDVMQYASSSQTSVDYFGGASVSTPPSSGSPLGAAARSNGASASIHTPPSQASRPFASVENNVEPSESLADALSGSRNRQMAGGVDFFSSDDKASAPFNLVPPTPRAGPGQPQSDGAEHPWARLFGKGSGSMTGVQPAKTPVVSQESYKAPTGQEGKGPMLTSSSSSASLGADRPQQQSHKQAMGMRLSGSAMMASNSTPQMGVVDMSRFAPIEPMELASLLKEDAESEMEEKDGTDVVTAMGSTLVIDIRPSTSYANARIRNSVNVCAPSTLLKRIGVTVDRIEEDMLSNQEDIARFAAWRRGPRRQGSGIDKVRSSSASASTSQEMQSSASTTEVLDKPAGAAVQRIVVLDTDTQSVTDAGRPCSGGGGPCLTGMLRKFDIAGFAGDLHWLIGGFNAFTNSIDTALRKAGKDKALERLVDREDVEDQGKDNSSSKAATDTSSRATASAGSVAGKLFVQPRGLPMEAFLSSTTTSNRSNRHSQQEGSAAIDRKPGQTPSFTASNPFYDTIRQNRELQHGFLEKISLDVPTMSANERAHLPSFLQKVVGMPDDERASIIAKAFFGVELAERDRLMATMQQHSQQNVNGGAEGDRPKDLLQLSSPFATVQSLSKDAHDTHSQDDTQRSQGMAKSPSFPFSISAAIERGSENRYNNIWTYEHSRVKCPDLKDFFNGSHIQPGREFGCARRYIATQAPLPATFETFWDIVWTQNVRVICMVTREFESGRVQGHNYWKPSQYGRFTIESVEEIWLDASGRPVEGKDGAPIAAQNGSYFGSYEPQGTSSSKSPDTAQTSVRRRLRLKNELGQSRLITQLHYIAWPDYSVPDCAASVLSFIRQANKVQMQADLEEQANEGQQVGPLVVHCSAGVGRTGTYIAIDTVLDILRRARTAHQAPLAMWDDGALRDDDALRGRSLSTTSSTGAYESDASAAKRRNLKRELSPSAMEVDADSTNKEAGRFFEGSLPIVASPPREAAIRSSEPRDTDSPPPARRSRSDDDIEDNAFPSFSQFSNGERRSSTGLPHSPLSSISRDGAQTPSTALGHLSLSASHGMPIKNRIAMQLSEKMDRVAEGQKVDGNNATSSLSRADGVSTAPGDHNTPRAEHPPSVPFPQKEVLTRNAFNAESGDNGRISSDAAVKAVDSGIDLVLKIVETMREQRMSMVQTTRQFVFAYRAVLEGVLYELRNGIEPRS